MADKLNDQLAANVKTHLNHYEQLASQRPDRLFAPNKRVPERPPIERVVSIYGVDRPTRSSFVIDPKVSHLQAKRIVFEDRGGVLVADDTKSVQGQTGFKHSGDGQYVPSLPACLLEIQVLSRMHRLVICILGTSTTSLL